MLDFVDEHLNKHSGEKLNIWKYTVEKSSTFENTQWRKAQHLKIYSGEKLNIWKHAVEKSSKFENTHMWIINTCAQEKSWKNATTTRPCKQTSDMWTNNFFAQNEIQPRPGFLTNFVCSFFLAKLLWVWLRKYLYTGISADFMVFKFPCYIMIILIVAKSKKCSTSSTFDPKISTNNAWFTTFPNSQQNSTNAVEIRFLQENNTVLIFHTHNGHHFSSPVQKTMSY